MKVDDLKNPNGLVLEVATKGHPASPSKTLTGVVVGKDFVELKGDGVTGEKLPINCVTIASAEVKCAWASLKAFYSEAA